MPCTFLQPGLDCFPAIQFNLPKEDRLGELPTLAQLVDILWRDIEALCEGLTPEITWPRLHGRKNLAYLDARTNKKRSIFGIHPDQCDAVFIRHVVCDLGHLDLAHRE